MARKKQWMENMPPAEKESITMRHIDLQRACIIRGITFDKLVNSTTGGLQDYFIRHYYDKVDNSRLDAFDEWREEIMKKRGKDEPFIRLGFIGEVNESGEVISIKKPKKFKKPKKDKREKNSEFNIWAGTKKELTYQCTREGKTLDETIDIVMNKFPDAKEKSIGIWAKRCLKASK